MESSCSLDVFFIAEKMPISKQEILALIRKSHSRWVAFWWAMALGFSIGSLFSLVVMLTTKPDDKIAMGIALTIVFAIAGGIFTYVLIRKLKQRKQLRAYTEQDVTITILNCVQTTKVDFRDEPSSYYLKTDQGKFIVSKFAYEHLTEGDRLAYVSLFGERFAFPLSCWSVEGIAE